MYRIIICSDWDKLPDSLKSDYEFMRQDCYNVLYIEDEGKIIFNTNDYGAPEDNSFLRDYKWIKEQLQKAYIKGYSDGCNNYES